jgi:transcription initiation factor TFIID subunit 2
MKSYLDEITHPMDFGTVSEKLVDHAYQSMEDIRKDIELVFSNCYKFNPPGTYPSLCADFVDKVFKKEWPKVMERKLSVNEKRGLQGVLQKLVGENMYGSHLHH